VYRITVLLADAVKTVVACTGAARVVGEKTFGDSWDPKNTPSSITSVTTRTVAHAIVPLTRLLHDDTVNHNCSEGVTTATSADASRSSTASERAPLARGISSVGDSWHLPVSPVALHTRVPAVDRWTSAHNSLMINELCIS
jgi:hypothetical protein